MRVALISWDYPPGVTGLGRAAGEVAAGLTAAGAEVEVFTLDRVGTLTQGGITIHGGEIERSSTRGWWRRRTALGHHAAPARFADMVRRRHRERAFDVAEATNWYAPAAHLPGRLPLLVRCSTPAIEVPRPTTVRARMDLAYANRLEARTARAADHIVSNTAPHRERIDALYRLGGRPHEVIALSLDESLIEAGRDAPPPPAPPSLLFIGRAERRKGFDAVLTGYARLAANLGDAAPPLTLIGLTPGDLAREAARLGVGEDVLARVTDVGRAEDAALRDAYARAAIVLAPSRYESYGLVYREAAAFGRPVVACAEDPAARDFFGRTGAGVLAARCDGEAVAEAISSLLHHPDAWAAAGRAGRAATAGLDRRTLGRRTIEAYERTIDAYRSRR